MFNNLFDWEITDARQSSDPEEQILPSHSAGLSGVAAPIDGWRAANRKLLDAAGLQKDLVGGTSEYLE